MATAYATKGAHSMDKKTVSISSKRQITIPLKFFNKLGFENEAECLIINGELVIRPVRRNTGSEFSENILEELISQGYEGQELLAKFKERQLEVRSAVVNMIEEAEKVANGEGEYYNYDEVFGSEVEE